MDEMTLEELQAEVIRLDAEKHNIKMNLGHEVRRLTQELEKAEAVIKEYANPENYTAEMLEDSGAIVEVWKEEIDCPCSTSVKAREYFAQKEPHD